MNNLYKILIAVSVLFFADTFVSAQGTKNENKSWRDRIMSEKIAFLTTEANITPEEAQKFWPVYNQICEERWTARHEVMVLFKKLDNAIKDNRPAKEITSLLDSYLAAIDKMREIDSNASAKFKDVLPAEKVARIYVSEEKFRRQQIHKLHHAERQD